MVPNSKVNGKPNAFNYMAPPTTKKDRQYWHSTELGNATAP